MDSPPSHNICALAVYNHTSSEGVAAIVKGYNQGCVDPGKSYGSGSFSKIFSGSDQSQKLVMKYHKIQIFSMPDIAIVSKLLYFGNLFGYKRDLP